MATLANTLEIKGIQETMKALKEIEPGYLKQVRKDIKNAGAPVLTAARSLIPLAPPLSGMARGNLIRGRAGTKWSSEGARKGFIIKTNRSGQRARTVTFKSGETIDFAARPYQLLTLTQRDAAGSIWDHAGRRTKGRFVTNLQMQGSYDPRAAEPGVIAARPAVENEVTAIVDKVMKHTNTKLKVRRGN
jgi:hypothetical protein